MAELRRGGLLALLLTAAGLLTLPMSARAVDAPRALQCWTDDRGQRACGDAPPPDQARRQRELIDSRGVVKKVLPAEKTVAQIDEEKRLRDERQRQEAYDRYLVQTYQNVGEIEKARDDRLAVLDNRMNLARKTLADTTQVIEELHRREAAEPKPAEDTPDPARESALKRQLREFSQAREENLSALARMENERSALVEQYARDIRRYRLLMTTAPRVQATP